MNTFNVRYSSLIRILLLIIGVWPYQRSKFTKLQSSFFLGILMTFVIFQFAPFLTSPCTMDLFIRVFSCAICFACGMVLYLSFYINPKIVKCLLDKLQRNYDELKDKKEIVIIENYWIKTKCYTIVFIALAICGLLGFFLLQFWPCILDIVLPINETRPLQQIHILTGHIDEKRHFYLIILHLNAALCIGVFVIIGTGTMMLAYIFHICGMFRIASHRVQNAMKMNMLQSTNSKKEYLIHKDIVCAVDIHRKAMQYSEYFMSKFGLWFAVLILIGVLSISLTLLNIFQTISSSFKIMELGALFVTVIVQYFYMFLANYSAQEVADHYNYLFVAVYNIRWYLASLHVQKMMLFLLQRGTKPYGLNLGGLFVASLEGFSTLMSASVSYFTIIYSVQQSRENGPNA